MEYLFWKSNNNSDHDDTSAFFDVFSEKDTHFNAIECIIFAIAFNSIWSEGRESNGYTSIPSEICKKFNANKIKNSSFY